MLTTFRATFKRRTEISMMLLGIGLASAFAWTAAGFLIRQFLEPIPVERFDRLVHLTGLANVQNDDPVVWWGRISSLESIANYSLGSLSLESDDQPVRVQAAVVSAGFFRTMGAPLAVGRAFTGEEDSTVSPVAVISTYLATRHFADQRDAVGKTIRLSGIPMTVVGVAPGGFSFPGGARVWLPRPVARTLNLERTSSDFAFGPAPSSGWVGRMRDGQSAASVRSEAMGLLSHLQTHMTPRTGVRYGDSISVLPMREFLLGRNRPLLGLVLIASAAVLFIACLNASLLMLGIASRRKTEFITRAALGATAGRIFRQVLSESVLVAALSGAAGVAMGLLLTRILPAWLPMNASIYDLSHSFIKAALIVVLLLAPITGMLAGLIPSIRAAGSASASLAPQSHHPGLGRGVRWLGGSLLAIQVGVSFCLVTVADTSIRSAVHFSQRNTGFDPSGVLTAALDLSRGISTQDPGQDEKSDTSRSNAALTARLQLLTSNVNDVPGISSSAWAEAIPGASSRVGMLFVYGGDSSTTAHAFHVSPRYFETMRIPLLRGRDFIAQDRAAIILSRSLAVRFFGGPDAVGRSVRLDGEELQRQVVAVADDVQVQPNDNPSPPQMYIPSAATYRSRVIPAGYFLARCEAGCTAALRKDVRAMTGRIAGAESSYDWSEYPELMARTGSPLVLRGSFFTAAAVLTLLILVCGVFSVMYHQSGSRSAEAGIHSVAGATPYNIVVLLLRDVLVAAVVGVIGGLGLSFATNALLKHTVLNVNPYDSAGYVRAAIVLTAAVVLSGLPPAIQLARRNPRQTLGSL